MEYWNNGIMMVSLKVKKQEKRHAELVSASNKIKNLRDPETSSG
jgi:hypothetical protein